MPGEDRRFQELSKLVKYLGIQIPKRFDSKLAVREFFYSREFILTLKSKMNHSLHSAIMSHQEPDEIADNL